MNSLSLDASDPEIRAACGSVKVGEEQTFTVTGVLTQKTDKSIVFKLSDVQYTSPTEESDEGEPPQPDAAGDAMTEQPTRPAAVSSLMS